jgi:alkylhydroperoxidase family enzyme
VPTHIVLGRSTGLSDDKLAHLLDDPLPRDVYDDAERVAIVYARRSTRMETIDDELYAELERCYPTEQVIELCFTVGLSNVVNRFHATFHTDLDPETADVFRDGSPVPLPRLDAPRPTGDGR